MGFMSKLRQFFLPNNKSGVADKCLDKKDDKRKRNANIQKKWLTLNTPPFFGKACMSPNKRWVVGCSDDDGHGTGGCRDKGCGRVLFLDYENDNVVFELTNIARPVSAAVADTGRFLVLDCCFGTELQSELITIDPDKTEVYRRYLKANIFSMGISKCGRYAILQTCNAPNEDGNILSLMDLQSQSVLFSVTPSTSWADRYKFKVGTDGLLVSVLCEEKNVGWFSYAADGTFNDSSAYLKARLEKGDYSVKILAAKELLDLSAEKQDAKIALEVVDTALLDGANMRSDWSASAHKIRGEAFEILDEPCKALEAYETALGLNPKIGVKRKIAAIKKSLTIN
ncbi:hypothetical protein B9086_004225 [Morganella morganii subsp. morganii]|uniref:hypothetical protein n=2 Tax=Morganella morganii TaxID=582 RepID=UPI00061F3282|nr:hypothetical protein [Morganella morganii]EHZ6677763.1 hypothetical protein [Morganella morganii]EJD6109654.1 hypothetical protein [Morganella morganii]EKU4014269.1 hypothetical protein [Morganella morganii]EKU8060769.1 hypothetical protein [Morganella morganii]ELA7777441.1 hypothetical protein [Morganella morganii]